MDWQAIATGLVTAAVAIPAAIYGARRYINRTEAADGAERFANDWHQKVIARQDEEMARQRAEIAIIRESSTMQSKRILELELDQKVKQKIIREIVADIRMVKRDEISLDQLQTGTYLGE